jgi:hypothetical protein
LTGVRGGCEDRAGVADGALAHTERANEEATAAPAPQAVAARAALGGGLSPAAVLALQRSAGNAAVGRILARSVSIASCSSADQTTINDTHARAMDLVANALTKLAAYTGTTPTEVHDGLLTHLKSASTIVAWAVGNHLRNARDGAVDASYVCNPAGTARGWSMWCVPFTSIELHPAWFADTDIDARARTMIHEWLHRYDCRFDVGYEHSEGYSGHGTIRSLLNADSMAHFVISVR